MTTKLLKQALQQALDELKFYADPTVYDADFMGRRHRITYVADSAIIAIEAALALPVEPEVKHEPMAWMFQHGETGRWAYLANDGMNHPVNFAAANPRYGRAVPLYIHPQAALPVEPAVQPVASLCPADIAYIDRMQLWQCQSLKPEQSAPESKA